MLFLNCEVCGTSLEITTALWKNRLCLDSAYVYIKFKAIPINQIYLHMHYYVVQPVDVIAVETK